MFGGKAESKRGAPFVHVRLFFAMISPMGKWCTVAVTDGEGRRYSLDVLANSSYDAAHLYLTHVRANPGCGMPIPTTATLFEVVAEGRVSHVRERVSKRGSRTGGRNGKGRVDSCSASGR
jgi:hypothetical protein